MNKLIKQIQDITTYLPDLDKTKPTVSSVAVGWHIEHILLVIRQITATVGQSDPLLYKSKFNFTRAWVYLLNYIPRGKAKAPKIVIPSSKINLQSLEESILHTYQAIHYLKDCQANQYFMHPIFGDLNQKQTIRFLAIHTEHHLKIIRDILK